MLQRRITICVCVGGGANSVTNCALAKMMVAVLLKLFRPDPPPDGFALPFSDFLHVSR